MKASKNETLLAILDTIDNNAAALAKKQEANKKPGPARMVKKPTLGSMFKQSLIDLMTTIDSTNVHYIRCIKPNEDKEAWKFDNLMVLSQLRACGVLETIRISCAGFPSRWTYNEFVLRYHILIPSENWTKIFTSEATEDDIRDLCKQILDVTVKDSTKYQLGNTKIFFKAGMLAYLEKLRGTKMHNACVMIQKKIKGVYYRNKYLAIQSAIHKSQAAVAGALCRQRVDYEIKTLAAISLQSLLRAHTQRKHLKNTFCSIIRVQSLVRRRITQKELLERREYDAAIAIQKKIRGFVPRKHFNTTRGSSVRIQSLVRRKLAQKQLKQLKADAKSVNHLQEVSYKLENKVIQLTQSLADKVKENREMTSRIEELQKSLSESANIKTLLESQKEEHSRDLQEQKNSHDAELANKRAELEQAKEEIAAAKQEIDSLMTKQEELRNDVRLKIENLNKAQQEYADAQTQNSDLKNEVKSLKDEISRLQATIRSGVSANTALAHTPTKNRRFSTHSSLADGMSPRQLNVISMNNGMEDDVRSTASALSQINDELYKILEDTKSLNTEIVEGLLKGFKIPETGVAAELTRKEVLYPARIMIIVLSDMWRLGLTKQSESFLAEAMSTIQKLVTGLKGEDMICHGAFWLTNVRELYSFVVFAQESILNDDSYNSGLNEDEYKEYVTLVTELKDDFESLSYNIYNIWLKKLQKDLEKKAVSAVVMSQSLPGFIANESSQFLPKLFTQSNYYKMDDILTFFNNIYWSMKTYHVEQEVFREVIITLLKYVDSICFNDLIMRRNFLSWKRGLQLNYNVTRLEEWCKSHHIPEGTDCLQHMLQASKLLQLKKANLDDIDIIWEICSSLKPAQIQKLITQYAVADYEVPIPQEILTFVANRVKSESSLSSNGKSQTHSSDIFLHVENGPFEDPFSLIETRRFGKIEAYIPAWMNLPLTRRVVELVTQHVTVQEVERAS